MQIRSVFLSQEPEAKPMLNATQVGSNVSGTLSPGGYWGMGRWLLDFLPPVYMVDSLLGFLRSRMLGWGLGLWV